MEAAVKLEAGDELMGEQSVGSEPSVACPGCGYELATREGGVLAKCPECGAPSPGEAQHAARRRLIRWALLLLLWGMPVWALLGMLPGQNMMTVNGRFDYGDLGPWNGSVSLNSPVFAVGRLAGAALVLVGVGYLLASQPGGRTSTKVAWGVLAWCALMAAVAFSSARSSPPWWNLQGLGRRIAGWIDTWSMHGARAACVWLIAWCIGHAAASLGFAWIGRVLCRAALWLALAMLLMAVWVAAVQELRQTWQVGVSQMNMNQNQNLARMRGGGRVAPMMAPPPSTPSPWYFTVSWWIEYWFPAIKAGVLAALWFPALVVRTRTRQN